MSIYFILTVVSIISAVFVVAIKSCFASKCENFSICWGLMSIHREVQLENSELSNNGSSVPNIPIQRNNALRRNILEVASTPESVV